jgi:hypothetical protein
VCCIWKAYLCRKHTVPWSFQLGLCGCITTLCLTLLSREQSASISASEHRRDEPRPWKRHVCSRQRLVSRAGQDRMLAYAYARVLHGGGPVILDVGAWGVQYHEGFASIVVYLAEFAEVEMYGRHACRSCHVPGQTTDLTSCL